MDQQKTGKFIQQLRKEQSMTQKELSERINVSDKAVSKWETGNGMPDMSSILTLSEVLGVSINELLSGERISPVDYSSKAEDNMVSLLQENEASRKGNGLQTVFGCVLAVISICMAALIPSMNHIIWYLDLPSFIEIAVICGSVVLLSGKKKKADILGVLQKTVIPAGLLVGVLGFIAVCGSADDASEIGRNASVVLLGPAYSILAYLVLTPVNIRLHSRKRGDCNDQ